MFFFQGPWSQKELCITAKSDLGFRNRAWFCFASLKNNLLSHRKNLDNLIVYCQLKMLFQAAEELGGNCSQVIFMGCSWMPDRKVNLGVSAERGFWSSHSSWPLRIWISLYYQQKDGMDFLLSQDCPERSGLIKKINNCLIQLLYHAGALRFPRRQDTPYTSQYLVLGWLPGQTGTTTFEGDGPPLT